MRTGVLGEGSRKEVGLEVGLAGGAEPAEMVRTVWVVLRTGTSSRGTTVSGMSTACSKGLEGAQPDMWPLEKESPPFS